MALLSSVPSYVDLLSSVPSYVDHNNCHLQLQQASVGASGGGDGGGGSGGEGPKGSMVDLPILKQGLKCPRCDSTNTKFCYFNDYSLTQPRHFCKTCTRYWTRGE